MLWLLVPSVLGFLNCSDEFTLPAYESEYLFLRVDGPTSLVLTSNDSTVTDVGGTIVNGGDFTLQNQENDWRVTINHMSIASFDESQVPAAAINHHFVLILYRIQDVLYKSFHYVGSDDTLEDSDYCDLVIGKSMTVNAPLASDPVQSHPVDPVLQFPSVVAHVRGQQLVSVYQPLTHDAPNGQVVYSDDAEQLTIQTQTVYGYPINRLASVNHSDHIIDYTGLDYGPLATGIHLDGMPAIHATTNAVYFFENNLTTSLDSMMAQKVLAHLNQQPSSLRSAITLPIDHDNVLIPVFAGANPLGLIDPQFGDRLPTYSVELESFAVPNCDQMVDTKIGSTPTTLCYDSGAGTIYTIDGSTSNGIESSIDSIPGVPCSASTAQLIPSGDCAALFVCIFATNSGADISYIEMTEYGFDETFGWTYLTLSNIQGDVKIAGASPTRIGYCGGASPWGHTIYVMAQTTGGRAIYTNGASVEMTTFVFYAEPQTQLISMTLSTDAYSKFDWSGSAGTPTDAWNDEMTDNYMPSTTLYYTTLTCPPSGNCTVVIATADTTPSNDYYFGLTIVYSGEISVTKPQVYDTSYMPDHPMAHVRVNLSNPMVPSFAVDGIGNGVYDTFVVTVRDGVVRCVLYDDDESLCIHTITGAWFDNRLPIFASGPMIFIEELPIYMWFNMQTLILSLESVPESHCHGSSTNGSTSTAQAFSIGGSYNYSLQALTSPTIMPIPNYTNIFSGGYDHSTGAFKFYLVHANSTDAGTQRYYTVLDVEARCSTIEPPTVAAYFQLYPGSPRVCDNLDLLSNGTTFSPQSPYLPTDSTGAYTADTTPSGTPISVPHLSTHDYFSYTSLNFCDGDSPPVHHELGNVLSLYDVGQRYVRRRLSSYRCVSVHSEYPVPLPINTLLMETDTRVFWYDYPLCYNVNPATDPLGLPWTMSPTVQPGTIGVGHSQYAIVPPPTSYVCDYNVEFYNDSAEICTNLTICGAEEFEVRHPQYNWDRICQLATPCVLGVNYETTPKTTTTDRVCTPISSCKSTQHVTIGTTTTSDVVCRNLIQTCLPGQFLNTSSQVDAQPGETVTTEQCPVCTTGTTWNPACENGREHCNPHHTETTCTEINVTWTCPDTYYLSEPNLSAIVGHPIMFCVPCGSCTIEKTPCTATSNTVCSHSTLGAAAPDVPLECPPGQFPDYATVTGVPTCQPWRECAFLKIEGTPTSNRVCATIGSEQYVYEVIYVVFIGLVAMVAARVWINHTPASVLRSEARRPNPPPT